MYAIGIPFLKVFKYERSISNGKKLDFAAESPSVDLCSVSPRIMYGLPAKITLHLYLRRVSL